MSERGMPPPTGHSRQLHEVRPPGSVGLHEVNVAAVIEHIMALMQFEAEERKIRLEQAVEERCRPFWGMRRPVSQVLVNIVVNAFHAMPNGGLCRILRPRNVTTTDAMGDCR